MSEKERFGSIPPWDELDFARNCTAWGNWFSTILQPNTWDPVQGLDGGVATSLNLFLSSAPLSYHSDVLLNNVSYADMASEILGWWTYQMYSSFVREESGATAQCPGSKFLQNIVEYPALECPEALCKAYGYSGNDDITGIGVYISYYMQAALSTLYLLAFTVSYFRSTSSAKNTKHDSNLHLNEPREDALRIPDIPNPALGQRKLDAFRGSLDTFFTTSMIMSVAMLCAAIYLAVESGKGRKTPYWEQVLPFGDSSVYNMVVSVTASGFSVFPVIVIAMQVWPPLFPQVAFREIDTEILASFRVMDWL